MAQCCYWYWLRCLVLFYVCMASGFLVMPVATAKPTNNTPTANTCNSAKQALQTILKKENAIREGSSHIFHKQNLVRTEIEIAHLSIERELLALSEKGILHTCDFGDLSQAGLARTVSDDGKFYLYRWVTDDAVPETIIYTYVMYVPPKTPQAKPASHRNRDGLEFAQLVSIAKPSDDTDADFPIYMVASRSFARGQHRVHCDTKLDFYQVTQHDSMGYISGRNLDFLDAKGKQITSTLFSNACDGGDGISESVVDNQFHYDAKTRILSFRVSKLLSMSEKTYIGVYGFIDYRFRFNGEDFVQVSPSS